MDSVSPPLPFRVRTHTAAQQRRHRAWAKQMRVSRAFMRPQVGSINNTASAEQSGLRATGGWARPKRAAVCFGLGKPPPEWWNPPSTDNGLRKRLPGAHGSFAGLTNQRPRLYAVAASRRKVPENLDSWLYGAPQFSRVSFWVPLAPLLCQCCMKPAFSAIPHWRSQPFSGACLFDFIFESSGSGNRACNRRARGSLG